MIVVGIETSGVYPEKHGIWQIDSLDFRNPNNFFIEECRIDNEDEVEDGAVKVHGKDEAYLRDKKKQPQKKLIEHFFKWCETVNMKNALCPNPQFDLSFINYKARKYKINKKSTFHHRAFDLHSIAQAKYAQLYHTLLFRENCSDMGLSNILKLCGMQDNRKEHNALEDAKLTAECFSRLIYGKSLFPEYSQFTIPQEKAG